MTKEERIRQVLFHHQGGMSSNEIAKATGIDARAVHPLLRRSVKLQEVESWNADMMTQCGMQPRKIWSLTALGRDAMVATGTTTNAVDDEIYAALRKATPELSLLRDPSAQARRLRLIANGWLRETENLQSWLLELALELEQVSQLIESNL
jgi:hypothetical protein